MALKNNGVLMIPSQYFRLYVAHGVKSYFHRQEQYF